MDTGRGATPDLVIAGAARSGTSFLAARLGEYPDIDPCAVKEPNYYSRHHERGPDWYDSLFAPREAGRIRLDASVSYTYPQFPQALERLAAEAPDVRLVYAVREPVARAVSHYSLYRSYFDNEPAETFGAALADNPVYAGSSDYDHWLSVIDKHFPPDHVLVVPFAALTSGEDIAVDAVCRHLLDLDSTPVESDAGTQHQNQVVTFRNDTIRRASRVLRHSRYYPLVRSTLGADRLRRVRRLVTRDVTKPSQDELLDSCTSAQREELAALAERAGEAVRQRLREQDARTGVGLLDYW